MNAVKILIDKYSLEDSMKSNDIGVFNDPYFQKLYDDLMEKGLKSKKDALEVGMTIEDVDIYDLEKFMTETDNTDIKTIFTNLNNGSMNHMRAFKRQLDMLGENYKAQYITEERMNKILSAENQHGHGEKMMRGNGHGKIINGNKVSDAEKGRLSGQENKSENLGFFASV